MNSGNEDLQERLKQVEDEKNKLLAQETDWQERKVDKLEASKTKYTSLQEQQKRKIEQLTENEQRYKDQLRDKKG